MNEVPGGPDGRPEPARDFVQGKPQAYGGQAPNPDWRQYAKAFIWVIIAVLAALFLIRNSAATPINFVFFEVTVPLYLALIAAMVLGALLGGSAMWWRARRQRRAARVERED